MSRLVREEITRPRVMETFVHFESVEETLTVLYPRRVCFCARQLLYYKRFFSVWMNVFGFSLKERAAADAKQAKERRRRDGTERQKLTYVKRTKLALGRQNQAVTAQERARWRSRATARRN